MYLYSSDSLYVSVVSCLFFISLPLLLFAFLFVKLKHKAERAGFQMHINNNNEYCIESSKKAFLFFFVHVLVVVLPLHFFHSFPKSCNSERKDFSKADKKAKSDVRKKWQRRIAYTIRIQIVALYRLSKYFFIVYETNERIIYCVESKEKLMVAEWKKTPIRYI